MIKQRETKIHPNLYLLNGLELFLCKLTQCLQRKYLVKRALHLPKKFPLSKVALTLL